MGFGYADYKDFLDSLLEKFEDRFAPHRILSIALFGSVARGSAGTFSDLDLLFIHEKTPNDPIKKWVEVLLEIRKEPIYERMESQGLYPEPSCIFMTPEELCQKPLILLDIMDHGIILKDEKGFLMEKIEALRKKLEKMGTQKILLSDGSWAWDLKPDLKPGEVFEIAL